MFNLRRQGWPAGPYDGRAVLSRDGEVLGLVPGQEDAPVVRLLQTVFEEARRSRSR